MVLSERLINSKPVKGLAKLVGIGIFGWGMIKGIKFLNYVDEHLYDVLHSETANAAVDAAKTANDGAGNGAYNIVNNYAEPLVIGYSTILGIGLFTRFMRLTANAPSEEIMRIVSGTSQPE